MVTNNDELKKQLALINDYYLLDWEPNKCNLVPFGGFCYGIKDEKEITSEFNRIIIDRIIPDGKISVEQYYEKLKIYYTNSLAKHRANFKIIDVDRIDTLGIIINERIVEWLCREITRCRQSEYVNKTNVDRFVRLLMSESYDKKGNTFLNSKISIEFVNLITGEEPIINRIEWNDTDWKLYLIIEYFIASKMLRIRYDLIFDYIMSHFEFPSRKMERKTLVDSIRRAKNQKSYKNFTAKISELATRLS
jgi:hypothetical protein